MKKIKILFMLMLCSVVTLQAQFLLTEYFSGYSVDAPVGSVADPSAGRWTFTDETGNTSATIVNEQLLYPAYSASGRGKAMSFTAPSTHPKRNTALCLSNIPLPYPCQSQGGFIEGSNVFYTAFLVDLSQTTTQEIQEIFSYYQLSTTGRRGCVLYQLSSDKRSAKFAILKKNEETIPAMTWTPYVLISSPILLVVKYTHVCVNERSLGHASFDLFVNPDPAKTEAANSATKLEAYGNAVGYDTDLRYIAFRQSGRTVMKIGGIRIANSFEQVLTGTEETSSISTLTTDRLFSVYGKNIIPRQPANGQLLIYNVNASLLRSYNITGSTPVPTNLDAGVYLLKYKTQEQEYSQKIFIH